MPKFEAYHGKDSQFHQTRFDALAPKGWRMISLSVHGNPSNPRYSAVWVKEHGPKYVAVHGLPISKYQKWFDDQTKKHYSPVIVSAAGGGANAVVAAVFEKGLKKGWIAKHGLVNGDDYDQSTIEFWCKKAREDGLLLRSGSIYGSSLQPLYIAVWHEEREAHWNWRTAESTSTYQTWFNAFREVPLRPGFVTLSEYQVYFSAFRDDSVGEWYARHNMTSGAYQDEFDDFKKKGFYPFCVQGGGEGSKTRYAAIFAKRHTPLPRKWTVRGTGLGKFDAVVKKFMLANGIRAGQLSIAKNGVFKAQRAYTWAHKGYPITETSHLMRIASVSKMFTSACIQRLYDDNLISEDTKVFPKLGITTKALVSQTVDPRVNDIEVQHLVTHYGGWDSALIKRDYVFEMRKIANNLGLSGPATKFDLVRYVYGEPLQFTPGSMYRYSNIGYTTLAYLVEKVTGQNYETYLKNTILQPDGITEVRLAHTLRSQRYTNEVFYDDPNVWYSAAEPTKDKLTAVCYGGEGWTTEAMDGSGGLCATANALVQFIQLHAVWGLGGRAAPAARSGSMAGVSSWAQSRTDGLDFAFIFNTRHLLKMKMSVDDLEKKLNSMLK
jgi:CubicO group peptidase (beta-lactamase class C family)